MSERETILANHILSNIQQNLSFLKEQNFINAQTHDEIVRLLPQTITAASATEMPLPSRKSAANIPPPNPRPNSFRANLAQPPPRRTPGAEINDAKKQFPIPKPMMPTNDYNNEKPPAVAMPMVEKEPIPPAYSLATAEALYDYQGQDHEDLSFRKGDIIEITEFVNDDWWRGKLQGRTGLFPQNHVVKIENPANKAKRDSHIPPPPSGSTYGVPPPPASPYSNPSTTSLPYNYPPPPAMYQAPPAGNYAPPPPGQAAYGAPPPVQAEAPAEDGKGKKFAKKFGSQVATGAAWGIGMSAGSELVHSIF
ncbi:protein that induces appearance of [PIN+] prion when overproduced [Umbelopsis nana]